MAEHGEHERNHRLPAGYYVHHDPSNRVVGPSHKVEHAKYDHDQMDDDDREVSKVVHHDGKGNWTTLNGQSIDESQEPNMTDNSSIDLTTSAMQGRASAFISAFEERIQARALEAVEDLKVVIAAETFNEEAIDEAERPYGQKVRINTRAGDEFHGKIGRVAGKEGKHYRVKLEEPVHIPGVGHVRDDLWEPQHLKTIKEDVETIDEISGKTLGSYIQKARADASKKRDYSAELDNHPSVKKHSDKRMEYYDRKEYDSRGHSKHQKQIDNTRVKERDAKLKLDPNYVKNTNSGKRYRGIDQAIRKLQTGKLTNEDIVEAFETFSWDDLDLFIENIEVETLDELSRKTLTNYAVKAAEKLDNNKVGKDKRVKRQRGLNKVFKQLTREEVEELDELTGKGSLEGIRSHYDKKERAEHKRAEAAEIEHGEDHDDVMIHQMNASRADEKRLRANSLIRLRNAANTVRTAKKSVADAKADAKQHKDSDHAWDGGPRQRMRDKRR